MFECGQHPALGVLRLKLLPFWPMRTAPSPGSVAFEYWPLECLNADSTQSWRGQRHLPLKRARRRGGSQGMYTPRTRGTGRGYLRCLATPLQLPQAMCGINGIPLPCSIPPIIPLVSQACQRSAAPALGSILCERIGGNAIGLWIGWGQCTSSRKSQGRPAQLLSRRHSTHTHTFRYGVVLPAGVFQKNKSASVR